MPTTNLTMGKIRLEPPFLTSALINLYFFNDAVDPMCCVLVRSIEDVINLSPFTRLFITIEVVRQYRVRVL